MLLGAVLGIADQFAVGSADNLRNTALVAALLLVGQGLRIWREGWEEQKQHDDEEDALVAAEAAILEAFQHPRAVDLKLFDAHEARRILDRLVRRQDDEDGVGVFLDNRQ